MKRLNKWPQAALHDQWPGNGSRGDPIFDAFYSSNVQFISNATYQETAVQAAGRRAARQDWQAGASRRTQAKAVSCPLSSPMRGPS